MKTITQTQIGAYERCKRFYYLRYIEKLAWPVDNKTGEEIQRGSDFHLLARQLIMGLDHAELIFPSDDEKMVRWIDNFCRKLPLWQFDRIYAEKEVTALCSNVLWLGMFDALAVKDDHLTIFDWKTTGHPASAADYIKSPQTKLYRFLAKTCAPRLLEAGLHGLPAENIEMIYWFPEHPETEIRLPYSESAFREDLTWLQLKAAEMNFTDAEHYPRNTENRGCRFCNYETYCFPHPAHFEKAVITEESGKSVRPPDDLIQPEFLFEDFPDEDEREGISF